ETSTLDGWRSDSMIVQQAFRDMKMDPRKDSEQYGLFSRRVEEEQVAAQKKLGRKLTNEEMQTITDKLKIQVVTDRGFIRFFDTKQRMYEVNANTGTFEVDIDEVPA